MMVNVTNRVLWSIRLKFLFFPLINFLLSWITKYHTFIFFVTNRLFWEVQIEKYRYKLQILSEVWLKWAKICGDLAYFVRMRWQLYWMFYLAVAIATIILKLILGQIVKLWRKSKNIKKKLINTFCEWEKYIAIHMDMRPASANF